MQAASADDVDRAVDAAKAALVHPSWKKLPGTGRGKLMAKLADLIEEQQDLLASIDAWDNGRLDYRLSRGFPELIEAIRQTLHRSTE